MLTESGNVFKDQEKKPLTKRIDRADVDPTLKWLESILVGFDLMNNKLGSTGKKPTSGDLDIAIDSNVHSKEEIIQILTPWVKEHYPEDKLRSWIAKSGVSVHFKAPINGNPENGFVQTDLMMGDPIFLAWASSGEPGNQFRGQHRQILLASIAKANGYRWSGFYGLTHRVTGDKTTDPREITNILLGPDRSPDEMTTIPSILNAIKNKDNYEELVSDAVATFPMYGVDFPDKEDSDILEEGKMNPRIQHAEDVIFWEGSKGALRAVNLLASLASEGGREATTVKWDGSPAIIFGRDENGEFIFTDKSGFGAKGYDGRAKSAEQLYSMFVNVRKQDKGKEVTESYEEFARNMALLFPLYEAAVPADHRGFFFGDLLYYSRPEIVNGKYFFKPNIVSYFVDPESEIGERISRSISAVVVHREVDFEDNKHPFVRRDIFKNEDVYVVPPVTVVEPVEVNTDFIGSVTENIEENAGILDAFLNPEKLKSLKLSNFANTLYTYLNSKVDTGLHDLSQDYMPWVQQNHRISEAKKGRIADYVQHNLHAFETLWKIVGDVMTIKNDILKQLEVQSMPVRSFIGDLPAGEGFVTASDGGDIKLVDREGFTKANRSVQREQKEEILEVVWNLFGDKTAKSLDEWNSILPSFKEPSAFKIKLVCEALRSGIPMTSIVPNSNDVKKVLREVVDYCLTEGKGSKKVLAIYPGRFQPMGQHHFRTYQEIANKYGVENTFIATSGLVKSPRSPLSFEQKKAIMVKMGIPAEQIIETRSPYQPTEITQNFDPDENVLVFFVGKKDMEENPRFKSLGGMTKKGTPSYYKKFDPSKELCSFDKHGYISVAPHVKIDLGKYGEMSGTSLRKALASVPKGEFKNIMGFYDSEIHSWFKQELDEMSAMGGGAVQGFAGGGSEKIKKKKTPSIGGEFLEEEIIEEVVDYLLGITTG